MYTLLKKCIFSCTSEKFFSLSFKLFRFSIFLECRFGRDQRSQFKNKTFVKNFSAMEILGIGLKINSFYPSVKMFDVT